MFVVDMREQAAGGGWAEKELFYERMFRLGASPARATMCWNHYLAARQKRYREAETLGLALAKLQTALRRRA